MGRKIVHFESHPDESKLESAFVEAAEGRRYKGGINIEFVCTSGDDWLVEHVVYGRNGVLLKSNFRAAAKYGL